MNGCSSRPHPSELPARSFSCLFSCVMFCFYQVEAAKHDLNYIGLTGNIGCMGEITGHRRNVQRVHGNVE